MGDKAAAVERLKAEANELQRQIKEQTQEIENTTLEEVVSKSPATAKVSGQISLKARKNLKGHFAKVYAVHWAMDGKQLVSASQDGKLLVWNGYTANKIHCVPLKSTWVMTCAFSPSANLVACGGLDNICTVYNLRDPTMKPQKELIGHTGYLSCCRFVNDRQILTSSGDMNCMLWDIETGMLTSTFTDHNGDVMTVSVSPTDSNVFVSGACDSTAKLWDMRTGDKCTQTFLGHEADINSVHYFPTGLAFATGSDDKFCKLYDIRSSGLKQETSLMTYKCADSENGVTSVHFSYSGRYLFSGLDSHSSVVYDTLRGKQLQNLMGHSNRISCLGVSPDGMALATGSWDTSLKIWA
eukprot:GFYU01002741.1.p1 GENE.GFYU01002741.1~~GFYU01002741.1.p1  ORF type:complete len:354 (-),score=75.50 GFYU01002741.1:387-1448(-)